MPENTTTYEDTLLERAPTAGHNSLGNDAVSRLRSYIDRVERLQEEKKALTGDVRDIFIEAKSAGFDVKALREILKIRGMDPQELEEREQMVDLYRNALS